MNYVILNTVLGLAGFILFIFLQALFINGWHECFRGDCTQDINRGRVCGGNIFFRISPEFIHRHKDKFWARPVFGCVKCEASVMGSVTYWPTALIIFGFHPVEIPIWIGDMFILVILNWLVYKKL